MYTKKRNHATLIWGQHHEIFNFFCKKNHLGHRTDKKRFRDFFYIYSQFATYI